MIDSETSLRLRILRFPLIVGVVFIHAYQTNVVLASGPIGSGHYDIVTEIVRNIISQVFARTAVPLFFLMSGYLFFAGFEFSTSAYIRKLRSRIKTLLIPFIFWNCTTLLVIMVAQAIPATQVYFSGKYTAVAQFGILDYVCAIFGIGRWPISYQLWFIRDLMIVVLLVPLISWLIKLAPAMFLSSVFLCWFLNLWSHSVPSLEAILCFTVGGYLVVNGRSLFVRDNLGIAFMTVYAVIAVLDALTLQEGYNGYLHRVGIVVGVVSILYATKYYTVSPKLTNAMLSLGCSSFFVYAAHEPLLSVVRKVTFKGVNTDSSGFVLVLYFFVPTVVIFFLVVAHRFLSAGFPKIVAIVSGGR